MYRRTVFALVASIVALCAAVGCAGREQDAGKVKVYPVEGVLLVAGNPAANARLAFHPVDKTASGGICPVGITRPDGSYRLSTFVPNDGAPEGEYVVTIVWPNGAGPIDECECPDPATHDRLCGQYTDSANSPLRATVRPEHNQITLRATVGAKGWNLPRTQGISGKNDPAFPDRSAEAEAARERMRAGEKPDRPPPKK